MTDLTTVIAFVVVVLVLLALVSYMLYRRGRELGHAARAVAGRLVIFWLAALVGLAVGVYFGHLYPEGLLRVNFSGATGGPPVAPVGGQQLGPAVGTGLAVALAALVAWLAIRPLQKPSPETPEEPQ